MNEPSIDRTVEHVAREILDYLQRNPRSSDTIEGIEHWWLPGKQYSRVTLRAALEHLVARKQLQRRQQANGRVYSLADE